MNAAVETELVFKVPSRVGALADVAETLRDAGVDIRAIGAYDKEDYGEFMLIASDAAAGRAAIEKAFGVDVLENTVVTVEVVDRPGALAEVARKVADGGINVGWIYASTSGSAHAMLVLRTADNQRVADLLA